MIENISASVGFQGTNRPVDVDAVSCALVGLGYAWASAGPSDLVEAIRLFQSACAGLARLGGDGRVDVGGVTARNLVTPEAPRWVRLPTGPGLAPYELEDLADDHDWCVHHTAEALMAAGCELPKGTISIGVNDGSRPRGGPTKAHKGHQLGGEVDVRLPRKDRRHGGVTWRDVLYDRGAMRAQLRALWTSTRLQGVLFNDEVLVKEGLCNAYPGHYDHVHLSYNTRP